MLEQTRRIVTEINMRPECEGLTVCQAIKSIAVKFLKDVINVDLLEEGHNPFVSMINCQDLFPNCM